MTWAYSTETYDSTRRDSYLCTSHAVFRVNLTYTNINQQKSILSVADTEPFSQSFSICLSAGIRIIQVICSRSQYSREANYGLEPETRDYAVDCREITVQIYPRQAWSLIWTFCPPIVRVGVAGRDSSRDHLVLALCRRTYPRTRDRLVVECLSLQKCFKTA